MLLASVETIRIGMGYDSNTDIDAAITEALHAAEPYIAARLNTPTFKLNTRVDKFYVEKPTLRNNGAGYTVLRLSSGLVTTVSNIVRAGTPSGFSTGTDLTSDLTDDLNTDALEKGLIKDVITSYNYEFVKVSYTAGFPADGDNPDSYDLDLVPDWLQIAARVQALIGLTGHPAFTNAKVDVDPVIRSHAAKNLMKQFEMTLASHLRYAPNAIMPL